jgi:hypothetical protein
MRDDELDRILSKEEELLPSSGFVASVMDAVQREAVAPPPIPFPWKRALPGMIAAVVGLVVVFVVGMPLIRGGSGSEAVSGKLLSILALVMEVWKTANGNWIVLALVVSFVAVKASMRVAGRKT